MESTIAKGRKFGTLTVMRLLNDDRYCVCWCDCEEVLIVAVDEILDGEVSSCGCRYA